jgi:hypothetical protein
LYGTTLHQRCEVAVDGGALLGELRGDVFGAGWLLSHLGAALQVAQDVGCNLSLRHD